MLPHERDLGSDHHISCSASVAEERGEHFILYFVCVSSKIDWRYSENPSKIGSLVFSSVSSDIQVNQASQPLFQQEGSSSSTATCLTAPRFGSISYFDFLTLTRQANTSDQPRAAVAYHFVASKVRSSYTIQILSSLQAFQKLSLLM